MRYWFAFAGWMMLLTLPVGVNGQEYRPSYKNPHGTEVVAVYLTASTCGPCVGPQMPALVDSVKVQLRRQAEARGQEFRAVFVGMDWQPAKAIALSMRDGAWDELDVGRNWFNAGAEEYVWGDPKTRPAMPQFIVYEQPIKTGGGSVVFGHRRALLRVLGPEKLAAWVAKGSPIPKPSRSSGR